ncbi:MAG TPA: segregation/condensation protein A [Terriglobales bacterium]|nr:segregation/condensation protein A [Terriglobales bacterium]
MREPLAVSLPRFDGPLDLLLELVRKNQVDIADIPIADITRQYLDYMHQAAELDLDLGAEFAYMAATLIQIKARSLLPLDPELGRHEPDSREELIRQLLDHAQVQQAAQFLQQQLEITGATWTRSSQTELLDPAVDNSEPLEATGSLNLLELARLAKKALETARNHQMLQFGKREVSIQDMIEWLQPRLSALDSGDSLPFDPLFNAQPDNLRRVALFLAVLELSKAGKFRLEQRDAFEPILLARPVNGTTVP